MAEEWCRGKFDGRAPSAYYYHLRPARGLSWPQLALSKFYDVHSLKGAKFGPYLSRNIENNIDSKSGDGVSYDEPERYVSGLGFPAFSCISPDGSYGITTPKRELVVDSYKPNAGIARQRTHDFEVKSTGFFFFISSQTISTHARAGPTSPPRSGYSSPRRAEQIKQCAEAHRSLRVVGANFEGKVYVGALTVLGRCTGTMAGHFQSAGPVFVSSGSF
ncbi:hypothetical protein HPB48_001088 [Haemaphysalis longicornis]|uniref:Uncharacterized protein n=1 Tax=Haemaphysalis longicornis TaxID=44386 RepID=A0A9J6GHC1_HAELO|nr:hypothetical protein HPB48_001088 [Haemaphysalis longicornis]